VTSIDGPASSSVAAAVAVGGTVIGHGIVEVIHVASSRSVPMTSLERVQAIAGVGLDGDRYATDAGQYPVDSRADRQLTLIAAEEIEALADRAQIVLAPGEARRNITTRGILLNELVGHRFRIGDVICEATRLCEPCQYLTDLLGKPVLDNLVHRAGLRARILSGGEVAVGSEVVALD
jgi:MOSC domain-containing protein YiiM